MKMKFRPFTALLLVLLLLTGVCAALFHTGFFDAFLVEEAGTVQQREGEGPVVRREVSKLVLPLESAENGTAADDALNEQDIAAGNNSGVASFEAEQGGSEQEEGKPEPLTAAENKVSEPKADSKPEAKPAEQKKPAASKKTSGTAVAKGVLSGVTVSCQAARAELEVKLSSAAGKVSWFNLDKPRRLVVDLHGKWKNRAKSIYRVKDCPVSKVVLGEHADKMRLVIYLDQQSVAAKIKPAVRRHDKGLSLSLDF